MIAHLVSAISIILYNNVALAALPQDEYGPFSGGVYVISQADDKGEAKFEPSDLGIDPSTTDDSDFIGWYIKTAGPEYTQITGTVLDYWSYNTESNIFGAGINDYVRDVKLCSEYPCGSSAEQYAPPSMRITYYDGYLRLLSYDFTRPEGELDTTDQRTLVGWYIIFPDGRHTKLTEQVNTMWYFETHNGAFNSYRGWIDLLSLCKTNPCPSDQGITFSPTPRPTDKVTPNPTSFPTPAPTNNPTPSPTERPAWMDVVDQLQRQIKQLEKRIKALEKAKKSNSSPMLFIDFEDKDLFIIGLLIVNLVTIIIFSYCYFRSIRKNQYSSIKTVYISESEDEENRRLNQ